MKLILIRHAETIENKEGIVLGNLGGRLSQKGKEQAKRVALRLKEEKIGAIYPSDITRAVDTGREIAKYHAVPFLLVEELREQDAGVFTGMHHKDIEWKNGKKEFESHSSMKQRSKKILEKAYANYPNGTVVFVAHDGILRLIIALLSKKPPHERGNIEILRYTSITIFEINPDQNKQMIFNSASHLSDS